jgi:RND family efflux transporter MFP subunit
VAKPTYTVQRGDVTSRIQALGRVAPVEEQSLFFRAEGRVSKVFFKEGDEVKKGDRLAELLAVEALEKQKSADQAEVRRAEIRLETARLNLELTQIQVYKWKPEYPVLVRLREYDIELAQINLNEVRARVKNLDSQVADATLAAPFDGRLTSLTIREGTAVKPFDTVGVVGDATQLEVAVRLDSTQLAQVSEGMSVTVVRSDRPGVELRGKVRKLPALASAAGGSEPLVRISLEAGPGQALDLTLGELARVTIFLQQQKEVLWLPVQAVRSFEQRKFVVVQDGAVQRRVDVKTGIVGEDRVEIIEGLQEGQVVVAP